MTTPGSLILSSGGLCSLVATASIAKSSQPAVLFVHDGRAGEKEFARACAGQAEHFHIRTRIELHLPHLHGEGDDKPLQPLAHLQLLTAAAGQAVKLGAGALVWPVCVGEHFETLAAIAESLVLLEHAVQLETGKALSIQTPLIELSLRQVVELGQQMQVPWRMARSCRTDSEKPCQACAACLARAEAFAAMGFDDPLVLAGA